MSLGALLRPGLWGLGLLVLSGCATIKTPDPRDPWESMNRSIYSFNDVVDRAVLKPVATGYVAIIPGVIRQGVGNVFGNVSDVWSAVNSALAARGKETGDNVGRVLVNSTVGILGLFDVATDLKIDKHPADFGLTLGRWGFKTGPFVMLPLLGPSTARGAIALPLDWQGDLTNQITPANTMYAVTGLKLVSKRADFLAAGRLMEGAAIDSYSFLREAYLQRQRYLDFDGNPPAEPLDNEPTPATDLQPPLQQP